MIIEDEIQKTMDLQGIIKRPLLIDEAQSGSTILTAAHFLYNRLQITGMSEKLYVIVAQDSRNGWLTNKRAHGFRTLVSNRRPHIQAEIVEMPLIYTDRQIFLNHLLYPTDGDPLQRPLRQKIVYNIAAIELVTNLALCGANPTDLDKALQLAQSNQETRDNQRLSTHLAQWIRGLLSRNGGETDQVKNKEILNWFINYKAALTA